VPPSDKTSTKEEDHAGKTDALEINTELVDIPGTSLKVSRIALGT
jgi:hypothetical protein